MSVSIFAPHPAGQLLDLATADGKAECRHGRGSAHPKRDPASRPVRPDLTDRSVRK